MKIRKAVIIGGGIGGHTLAVALEKVGIAAELFERAPKLGEVGSGIGLWANAVRVLDHLGIGGRIRQIGSPLRKAEIVSWRGRVLSSVSLESVGHPSEAGFYVLHRAELLDAIAAGVSPGIAHAEMECVRIEQDEVSVRAFFKNGKVAAGDILIGADGIHSVVRTELWGKEPVRYSGQTCYRGIAAVAPAAPHVMREIGGPGLRCAVCPLDRQRVYWWAALDAPQGEKDVSEWRQEFLLQQYHGWPFGIADLIAATPKESILRGDLIDRKPIRQWSRGRVTLLGDAAHPTTPNLGQGACMAIEDALVLARSLVEQPTVRGAFHQYEAERTKRTSAITRESWIFGQVARWKSPAAVRLRELIFSGTPAFVARRALRRQMGYDVGGLQTVTAL